MAGLTAVNLVWWLVGGGAAAIGVAQIASALGGPRERRSSAVIGVLLVLLGGLALLMPVFGTGSPPPGRGGAIDDDGSRDITAWSETAFADLLDALPRETFKLDVLQSEIIARLHDGEVNDTEVHALVEQCLAGSGAAR
ncbi:MAG: hypothetical protein ACYTGG_12535, partial [Planctomycetota bacterium]